MSSKFNIRTGTLDDLERIIDLNLKLFKFESSFNNNLNLSWTLSAEGKKYFQDRLQKIDGCIVVAELDNKVIAYLASSTLQNHNYYLEKNLAKVDNMFVLPDYRNMGVGSSLLEEFNSWCKKKNISKILTEVSNQNDVAQDFYAKNGFAGFSLVLFKKVK